MSLHCFTNRHDEGAALTMDRDKNTGSWCNPTPVVDEHVDFVELHE